MRLAYIVLAHRAPAQLARLVAALEAPDATFFVHVDRRTPTAVFDEMVERLSHVSSLQFLPRHEVRWAGFGTVAGALEGIAAVVREPRPPDYTILLSGQDYPLRSTAAIRAFLGRAEGRSYLEYFALPSPIWPDSEWRFEVWHNLLGRPNLQFPRRRVLRALIKRRFFDDFTPFGGSQWCLSRDCVEYVHRFTVARPEYVRFFRHVWAPDEMFFQTLLLNSPLAGTIENDSLRYIDWSADEPHPKTLTMEDADALLQSPALFARKFDAELDSRVLDLLDARIANSE